ncbi:DUF2141 domain-containing protein [Sandaracinus amylolyticus]|uniref:DUF2141 domain-containing protein n=1 Tax=Sandaracinus amylolyticus TaxID=927083 RepID=UPI001F3F79C7|nr:DUF2141 domain-containing protein [Sandaracinus amylolyticus]
MTGARLFVHVSGLRNDRGAALVALYDGEGFPDHPERAKHHGAVPIASGRAELVFDEVAPGRWAAALLHDEDLDLHMDLSRVGLPLEGLGGSRDREWRLGLPRFEKAAFDVIPGDNHLALRPRYLPGT